MKPAKRKTVKMNRCRYCCSKENLTVDHKIPKTQGGTDDPKNLQCLCSFCNQMKSGLSHRQVKNLWAWLVEVQRCRVEAGKKPYFEE